MHSVGGVRICVWRIIRRTWRRWRTRELLWGTNYERLWPNFMVWRKDSLLYWSVTQHVRKRNAMLAYQTDPRWSHIRFVRLTSRREVATFLAAVSERIAPVRQRQERA